MVVSWTLSMQRAPTRVVIEGGGLQARANLNGGELDKEPFLRDKRGKTTMTRMQQRKTKDTTLSPQTVLNGGEREQEHTKNAG